MQPLHTMFVTGSVIAACTGAAAAGAPANHAANPAAGRGWMAEYPILPWGVCRPKPDLPGPDSMKECGFTLAGFVRKEDLAACEAVGLKGIAYPDASCGAISRKEWTKLSAAEIDSRVQQAVAVFGKSDAIIGYYLVDEPGVQFFPGLGRAVAALKKYAPGKLAYINLFPNYATLGAPNLSQLGAKSYTEYLERYVRVVKPQFLSWDNYKVQYSNDLSESMVASSYYRNLLDVRRVALEHGLPFWHIVSSNQIRDFTTIPSPANLLFQAYTSLAAGAAGVSWYTYYSHGYGYAPIDKGGRRTATWGYLRMVNRHLQVLGPIVQRMRSTGVFFLDPPPGAGPALPGRIVFKAEAVSALRGGSARKLPLMLGEFADPASGTNAVLVVNLSLTHSAHVRLELAGDPGTCEAYSPEDGHRTRIDVDKGFWLTAGQGALFRVGK